ncbi:hypothetical protein BBJ28_00004397 [Nothophytophthora sp. Chile5]|nr:hypothetical protein BBJ28_00004397 [Nothophytophthora sp. Chile5]
MTFPDPEAQSTTERDSAAPSDCNTSVAVLVDTIATATATDDQQHALLLLVRRCIDSQERVHLYEANGIQVLSDVVKRGAPFVSQVYAIKCMTWVAFDDYKLSMSDFRELLSSIREAPSEEFISLVDALQHGSEVEKDDAVVLCASIATIAQRDELREIGVVPPVIEMLRNGTNLQKLWAVVALDALACANDENCLVIGREGGFSLLVGLVQVGTDHQRQVAARTLGNLAVYIENSAAIAQEGAVVALVALLRAGDDKQKEWAVYALRHLAGNDDASGVAIVREGGIPPLVALLQSGTTDQKYQAVAMLANLSNDPSRDKQHVVEIVREGAISPLVALVLSGTDEQKSHAANVLGNLAIQNKENGAAIVGEGAISPLVALVQAGTEDQKGKAAYALANIAAYDSATSLAIAQEGAVSPLVALLRAGDDKQKQWAVFALMCLSSNDEHNCAEIARENGIPPLVALLQAGTTGQKYHAVATLANLSNDPSRDKQHVVEIVREGAISPLVALVLSGTDEQKSHAANVLGNLAIQNKENGAAIVGEGAISPLVALVQAGTEDQKGKAAYALANIAAYDSATSLAIAQEGAVSPLVALLRAGDDTQKQWATYVLMRLSSYDEHNCAEIARENGIPPLVALLRTGTVAQKQLAAAALANLACDNAPNRIAIVREGAISPLLRLERTGNDQQKENAVWDRPKDETSAMEEQQCKASLEAAFSYIADLDSNLLADCQLERPGVSTSRSALKPEPGVRTNGAQSSVTAATRQKHQWQQNRRGNPPQLDGAASASVETGAAKPKKKRVRREKLELTYLRDLVETLEGKMAQLKARPAMESNANSSGTSLSRRTADSVNAVTARLALLNGPKTSSVWMSIAERQFKERRRAEEQNQKLRVSLEGQLKLASRLEGILRKRPRDEKVEALAGMKRAKPRDGCTFGLSDDEIFADQLAGIDRVYLEAESVFQDPLFGAQTPSCSKVFVNSDPTEDLGVVFETKANTMMPFDVKVTGNAFWRALAVEWVHKHSYFHEERQGTDDLVARTYALHFKTEQFAADIRGKHTIRRFVSDDRVAIVWKSVMEPIELNGTRFQGLICHQTGCIMLSNLNIPESGPTEPDNNTPPSMRSTALQAYTKMTLELQDDIVDQEQKIGVLTDFVVTSHETTSALCGKMIGDFLVEEDWNANGWLDSLAF